MVSETPYGYSTSDINSATLTDAYRMGIEKGRQEVMRELKPIIADLKFGIERLEEIAAALKGGKDV